MVATTQLQPVKRGTHETVQDGEHSAAGNAGVRDTRVRGTGGGDISFHGVHLGLRWQRGNPCRQHAGANLATDGPADSAAGPTGAWDSADAERAGGRGAGLAAAAL